MEVVAYLLSLAVCVFTLYIFIAKQMKNSRRPPGPWGLPFVGYLPFLGNEPQQTVEKLAAKFGNIFSLQLGGKYVVILNDYDTAKDVLSRPEVLSKAQDNLSILGDCGLVTADGEAWVQQRKVFMQVLKDVAAGSGHWNNLVADKAHGVVKMLQMQNGNPTDIAEALIEATVITLTEIGTGKRLQKGVDDYIIETLKEFPKRSFTLSGSVSLLSALPGIRRLLEYFNIAGYGDVATMIRTAEQYFETEVKNRPTRKDLSALRDFVNGYKERFEEKVPDSFNRIQLDKYVISSIKLLYLAISETTVSATEWLLRLMALYPDVQEKIHKELDRVMVADSYLTYEHRSLVPYTFATLMETLRYATVAPLLPSRRTTADIKVHDFVLPKGTEITTNAYFIHHNPKCWKNPHNFEPQRFITEDGTVIRNPVNYIPFSIGKRNCPGGTIAYSTMLIYFTALMKNFRIECPSGEDVNTAVSSGLVRKLQPQGLRFIERPQPIAP